MKEQKEFSIKKIFFSLETIVSISIYAAYLIFYYLSPNTIDSTSIVKNYFPNFAQYDGHLSTGIQVIIGLIVVVTAFYLGKTHDYKRDHIKQNALLYEYQLKIQLLLSKKTSIDKLEFSENSKTILKEKLGIEDITDGESLRKFCIQDAKETISISEQLEKTYSKYPVGIAMISFLLILAFVIVFFMNLVNQTIHSEEVFLRIIFGLFALGVIFSFVWAIFEKILSRYDEGLRILVRSTSSLKTTSEFYAVTLEKSN